MAATWRLALLPLPLTAAPLRAQSEAEFKRYFEVALAEYVTFPSLPVNTLASIGRPGFVEREDLAAVPAPRSGLPRKGMTTSEVDDLLGEPLQRSERPEGELRSRRTEARPS